MNICLIITRNIIGGLGTKKFKLLMVWRSSILNKRKHLYFYAYNIVIHYYYNNIFTYYLLIIYVFF